jgi:hypothetical protein
MVISVLCGNGMGQEENTAVDSDMDMTALIVDPQRSAEQKAAASPDSSATASNRGCPAVSIREKPDLAGLDECLVGRLAESLAASADHGVIRACLRTDQRETEAEFRRGEQDLVESAAEGLGEGSSARSQLLAGSNDGEEAQGVEQHARVNAHALGGAVFFHGGEAHGSMRVSMIRHPGPAASPHLHAIAWGGPGLSSQGDSDAPALQASRIDLPGIRRFTHAGLRMPIQF